MVTAIAPPSERCAHAVSEGVDALGRLQHPSGSWSDYRLGRQVSDEYVTAFVAALLTDVPGSDGLVELAWRHLAGRAAMRAAGGWGWNLWLPPDADSTAFALLAARAADDVGPECDRGLAFLAAHVDGDGARTYRDADVVRHVAAGDGDHAWTRPHACVTAAVAGPGCSLVPSLGPAVRSFQRPDGSWRGHWWVTSDYPTGISCTALRDDKPALVRAGQWARTAPVPTGAFDIAWRLVTVTLSAVADPGACSLADVTAMSTVLLSGQRADGSWAPSAQMRLPAPEDADPDARAEWAVDARGMGAVTTDHNGIASTASAVSALALAGTVLAGADA